MIIYVDMDNVICKYSEAIEEKRRTHPDIKYPQSIVDFFRNLKPIDGAIDGMEYLFRNFDTYILIAPSLKNPLSYMEKRIWVEEYLGFKFVEKLIISPNKSLLIGDYLIDDNTSGAGQDRFRGNLLQFGKHYPNWDSIINYFTNSGKIITGTDNV